MKELVASSDPVLLSALQHYLELEEIGFHFFDTHVSSLFPGDPGIAATRVMVADEDFRKAETVLNQIKSRENGHG